MVISDRRRPLKKTSNSRVGVNKNYLFSGHFMKFPDFRIVDPLKSPLGLGESNILGSYNSLINPNLPAKCVCSPTVVSKKGVQTNMNTNGHCSFIFSRLFTAWYYYNVMSRKRYNKLMRYE